MQLSTSVGKHWGRFGSVTSPEVAIAGWIPFWSREEGEELTPLSGGALPVFSVNATLLLPFTKVEVPGSVLTAPWLLTCGALGNFSGDKWFVTAPFVPCEIKLGVVEEFKEAVVKVREVFAVEEEDELFELLVFPILCFFLDFFSFSFSPLKEFKLQKWQLTDWVQSYHYSCEKQNYD